MKLLCQKGMCKEFELTAGENRYLFKTMFWRASRILSPHLKGMDLRCFFRAVSLEDFLSLKISMVQELCWVDAYLCVSKWLLAAFSRLRRSKLTCPGYKVGNWKNPTRKVIKKIEFWGWKIRTATQGRDPVRDSQIVMLDNTIHFERALKV